MITYDVSALAAAASALSTQTLNRLPSQHCGAAILETFKDAGSKVHDNSKLIGGTLVAGADAGSKVHDNSKLIGGTLVAGAATSAGAYLLWKKVIQPYAIPACQKWRDRSRNRGPAGCIPVGVGSESSDDGVDDVKADDMDYDGDDEYEKEQRSGCCILSGAKVKLIFVEQQSIRVSDSCVKVVHMWKGFVWENGPCVEVILEEK